MAAYGVVQKNRFGGRYVLFPPGTTAVENPYGVTVYAGRTVRTFRKGFAGERSDGGVVVRFTLSPEEVRAQYMSPRYSENDLRQELAFHERIYRMMAGDPSEPLQSQHAVGMRAALATRFGFRTQNVRPITQSRHVRVARRVRSGRRATARAPGRSSGDDDPEPPLPLASSLHGPGRALRPAAGRRAA